MPKKKRPPKINCSKYKCSNGMYVRSQYERDVIENMLRQRKLVQYESEQVPYKVIETRTYTPDLVLPSGVWVELKGWLRRDDRVKPRRIVAAYPTRNFCILFQKEKPWQKKGKTTNVEWARKVGLIAAAGDTIPDSWYDLPMHRTT